MAQYDVYPNPDKAERALIPLFLDIQSDDIQGLQTRVVVPLWASDRLLGPAETLNPEFKVTGIRVTMDTSALGAVPSSVLRKPVASLAREQHPIQNALDMLLGAY